MLLSLTAFLHWTLSSALHITRREQVRCNYQAGSAALRLTAKTNSGQITGTGLLCSGLLACCLQLGTTSADKLAGVASWTKKLDSVGRS